MIPIRYNLRSIVVRKVGTAMTVLGVALTVAVFVSILAMVEGLQNNYVETALESVDPKDRSPGTVSSTGIKALSKQWMA
jgi:ABC-type antimicrobial peptide transport system permease subunit